MSVIIRLQNLALAANASDVRDFFKGLAIPDGGVHIVGGAQGDAFIAFSTDEDARQAMALNGGWIKNEPISLLLSSRAEMQKVIDQARKAALTFMQLKQQTNVASYGGAIPQTTVAASAIAGISSRAVQQPQPPVISLAGFLAQKRNQTKQNSTYNEIPGLSFLSSDAPNGDVGTVTTLVGAASSLKNEALASWLSTCTGNGFNGVNLAGTINPPAQPIGVDNQSPWKFLKKDRRSPSPFQEGPNKRGGASRSCSRERDVNRHGRRSRSPSRDRRFKRDGRSRSSSRDRSRYSRSSSREYNRRHRNSRSRSPSRDRFGRTRQRSRSRSRDQRSRDDSRDRNPERAGNGFKREPTGRGRSNRVSRFSSQNDANLSPRQQGVMEAGSKSFFGNELNRPAEPIFGLHTTGGAMQDPRVRFGQSKSGDISPPLMGNGGLFRNTSPLPAGVYSGIKSSPVTSDYAIKVSNLETVTGYGEIRRFFKTQLISTQGIKMINDDSGRRTGVAYVQFLRKDSKQSALQRDGMILRRTIIRIESITDQEFEQAHDSYRPGNDNSPTQPWDESVRQVVNPWSMSDPFRERNGGGFGGNGQNNDVIENNTDQNCGKDAGRRHFAGMHQSPTSTLMVWNLPTFTTEQDIMKMFSDFTVVEVLIVKNHSIPKQLDGYVRFHRQEDAREAWSQMHRHFIGNKKVSVRMCPEIDYEVAKNEYENPSDTQNSSSRQLDSERSNERNGQDCGRNFDSRNGDNGNDGSTNNSARPQGGNSSRRRNNQGSRWGQVERNWDDGEKNWDDDDKNWDEDDNNQRQQSFSDAQHRMDPDSGAGSDTNASWNNRDPRMNRGGDGDCNYSNNFFENENNRHSNDGMSDNCNNNDNNGNSDNNCNNGNSRDPRISSGSGRFGGNSGGDNSELFQRTNWLLLRNVDFHVYEEDVFAFFAQDGFRAKNILVVRNERGGRTGECLVEFESASEAAHAESKSSQNLGRRKVFASHLDRGQVADLMTRFNAIAQGLQPSYWMPEHLRNDDERGSDDQRDDPEQNQGVGCGPYHTSTVGLLNLAYKTTVEDVQNFFQEFNLPVENIRRRFLDNGQATGEAMVRFLSHQDAEKALNEYQNRRLFGRNVRIRLINDD
ncbi:uncharacterized protein LOC128725048 [Anopheles nili]|uniref:uncharacterized protein LOC128725048 n=1 Tax=Anopheles nili TaxID=185578 RepID=UPI00237B8A93|nr:uncharacterized protein LOC128725048 [Anopheles nili]